MNALSATLVSFFVCCVAFGATNPTPQNEAPSTGVGSLTGTTTTTSNVQGHMVSGSQVVSAANGYLVKIAESQINDKCVSNLTILGNGVNKTVEYPCGKAPVDIINLDKGLLVGNEWFSDQPKTLVHLADNTCQREVFTEQDGKTSSTSESLSDEECEKVRTKITELKKEQQKWNEFMVQQQLAAQQHFQQLQQNLLWFQSQLFGNLFGAK